MNPQFGVSPGPYVFCDPSCVLQVDHVELVDNAARPNNLTYEVDGASPNPKMHEVLAPEGEAYDINQPIDLSTLPTWREQLTFRALFLGIILGGVFCIM